MQLRQAVFYYSLAKKYSNAENTPTDQKQALHYYELAAKTGHISAQLHLGNQYQHGLGIPKDEKKAIYYYQLAVDKNINKDIVSNLDALNQVKYYLGCC